MSVQQSPVDLVFEGGGVKGIGLAGAFFELYRQGHRPQCVAGTSAGAITAALVAAGYDGEELRRLVFEDMHFPSFRDRERLGWLGPLGRGLEILTRRGLHSGDYFLDWMRRKLSDKGVRTFADLRNHDEPEARRSHRLQVIASDLTDHSMLVLPRDAGRLGIDDPDSLPVAEAVRMSMSIPIFFEPVSRTDHSGRRHLIVDGGLLSNYPVWLFDAEGRPPRFPTLGMLLVAANQQDPLLPRAMYRRGRTGAPSLIGYVKAIAETMMQAHDRFYVEQANFARTIPIPTLGVTTTEFDIGEEQTRTLFESGRGAAEKFLHTWDPHSYVAKYRQGPPPARRESVTR